MTEGLIRGWEAYALDWTVDLVLGLTLEGTWGVTLEKQEFVLETDVEDQDFS